MPTLPAGEDKPAADRPGRYQIVAHFALAANGGFTPTDSLPEVLLDVTYSKLEPHVFVFCGVVRNQGALFRILATLVERGLLLQSVRRLEQNELLDPLCGQST